MAAHDIDLDFDENWTVVADVRDSSALSGAAVIERVGADVSESSRDAVVSALDGFAQRGRADGVIRAAVALPEPPIDGIVAYGECRRYDLGSTAIGGTAKQTFQMLSSGTAALPEEWRITEGLGELPPANRRADERPRIDWHDVELADLPAGPAVRIHDLDLRAEPIEMLAHLLPLGNTGTGVAVIVSWARLYGPRMFGGRAQHHLYDSEAPAVSRGLRLHADSLAESVRVEGITG